MKKKTEGVRPEQRFTQESPCPVCFGAADDPRGENKRCPGYKSNDGRWAYCARNDGDGKLKERDTDPPTYRHSLIGTCDACGETHGDEDVPPKPKKKKRAGKIVATYPYPDEHRKLLYEVVRFDPKGFRQRRPDGHGGWIWNLDDTRRVPFRFPELIDAAKERRTIYVAEGEKDVLAIESTGNVATCNPMGAGCWDLVAADVAKHVAGCTIIAVADRDDVGRRHVSTIARTLSSVTSSITCLEPPEPYKDVSDFLADGGSLDDLVPMTEPSAEEEQEEEEDARPPKQADIAVQLMTEACTFFHDSADTAYARTKKDGVVMRVRSTRFRTLAAKAFYERCKSTIGGSAMSDALAAIEGTALHGSPRQAVFVRVAGYEERIYIDLANDAHEVVEVTPGSWRIVTECPVNFIRPKAIAPLVRPVPDGDITDLHDLLNLRSGEDFILIVAWLIAALAPSGPYPVLVLQAQQGSGKTTMARVLRALVDPNVAPVRAPPKEPRDLAIAASNAQVIALDNMSGMPPWLSDVLCRISTGDGFSTRALYTDAEEQIFVACRPAIVNGIDDLLSRGDLADRALVIHLPEISKEKRKDEKTLWRYFANVAPRILGALLDGLAVALRDEPTVKLDELPRMADFVRLASAALPALGIPTKGLVNAMKKSKVDATLAALDADVLAHCVRSLLRDLYTGKWSGTPSDLLARIRADADLDLQRELPKTPQHLTNRLRRLAPALREHGVRVDLDHRDPKSRQRTIELEKLPEGPSASSGPSEGLKTKGNGADDGARSSSVLGQHMRGVPPAPLSSARPRTSAPLDPEAVDVGKAAS